jgi:hypothetical protein
MVLAATLKDRGSVPRPIAADCDGLLGGWREFTGIFLREPAVPGVHNVYDTKAK